MTDDLLVWLREQLDEDERLTVAARRGDGRWEYRDQRDDPDTYPWQVYAPDARLVAGAGFAPQEARHIANWDPARVLREVEAKRRILDACAGVVGYGASGPNEYGLALDALCALALPYSDRPGYRQEWVP